MPMSPPRFARWLLTRALPSGPRAETMMGDLIEEMSARAAASSPSAARRWYRRTALLLAIRYFAEPPSPTPVPDSERASPMDSLLSDLRYGLRSLLRARGFVTTAVVTLALGIGSATAVFSVVDAVLLRPLPFADPNRIMWMTEVGDAGEPMSVAWPDFLDWQSRATSFTSLSAVQPTRFNFTSEGEPERLLGRRVTASFFSVLGVRPAAGRMFTEAEDRPGAPRVVLISDDFWRRRFNADPEILGRKITLDGLPREIIGVLAPGFRYSPLQNDAVVVPLGATATEDSGLLDRGNHNGLSVIGRLKPGVDEAAGRQELDTISSALRASYPNTNSNIHSHVVPIADRLVNGVAPTLRVLFAAVACLLLLAAVNVASLLVARTVSRQHELSVRAALGCGRWRLVRQLMVEGFILAVAGGAAGSLVCAGLIRILQIAAPPNVPRLDEVRMDAGVWLFAMAASLIAALVLSAFPGLQSSGIRGQEALVRAGRGDHTTVAGQRIRRALMVVEVALAIVLLTGAGLTMRTMRALTKVDPGFDATNVLTMRFEMTGDRPLMPVYADMLTRVEALPGVKRAALTLSLPIEGSQWNSVFIVDGQPVPPRPQLPSAAFCPVTTEYFATMSIPVRAGRAFDQSDTKSSRQTAVVSAAFARRFWPAESAIGKRFKQGWPEDKSPWYEIVGVVGDVKLEGVDVETPMQAYLPMAQEPSNSVALVVRTATPSAALVKQVPAAVHAVAPSVPLYGVQTLDELMGSSLARQRVTMLILAGFAALALVLASVGLSGVVAQGVSARTREIGVRLALGAERRQVVGLFVRQGLITSVAGVAIGGLAALSLARLVAAQGLLFGVTANDPATFWTAVATLIGVSALACYIPARRAARINPTVALRGE